MRIQLTAALTAIAVASAATSNAAPVPPVSPQAQAAGFVDVRSVVPDAIVDLRYATADNRCIRPPPAAWCTNPSRRD